MPRSLPQPARQGSLSDPTLFSLRLFLVASLAFSLPACRKESKVDIATREKILLLGNGGEPKALDPHIVS